MVSGQGFVRERHKPSGTVYLACIKLPDPLTGKERETSKQFKTRREADRYVAELSAELRAGTLVARSPKTVADLLRYWDETYVEHHLRPTTALRYRYTIAHYLIPALGSVPVQGLTAAQVEHFYATRLAEGVGSRTMVLCHLRLNQALKTAVRLGWVGKNVLDQVTPPRDRPKVREPWSREHLAAFLTAAQGSSYGPIWLLMALTGMRRGEALGLRWSDVDLEGGALVVRQAYVGVGGQMVRSDPKGRGSRRTLPLHPVLVEALRQHREEQGQRRERAGARWQDNDLVFCTKKGTPIDQGNLFYHYQSLVASAAVPYVNIHGIRHAVASHLLAEGEDVKTVSDLLGHSRTSITLDTYAHVIGGRKRAAIDTLGSIMLGEHHEHRAAQAQRVASDAPTGGGAADSAD